MLCKIPVQHKLPHKQRDVVFSPRKSLQAVFSLGLMKTAVDEIIRETLAYVKDFCVLLLATLMKILGLGNAKKNYVITLDFCIFA